MVAGTFFAEEPSSHMAMERQTRGTATVVALTDAAVALLPKAAAYGVFAFSSLEVPVGSAKAGLVAFAVFALVVVAPYSYRRYRRDARPLAVTRGSVARVRGVLARLRRRDSSGAYFS